MSILHAESVRKYVSTFLSIQNVICAIDVMYKC